MYFRSSESEIELNNLIYPIFYKGPETEQKKVKDKIISKVLILDEILFDENYGEIANFINKEEDEKVTYVVSRKPYKKEFFKEEFTFLLNPLEVPFIRVFFNKDYLIENEDFNSLYIFLNNGVELDYSSGNAKKNVCHKLISYHLDDKESIDMIENLLFDEDYKIL